MDVPGLEKLKAAAPDAARWHFTTVWSLRFWQDEDGSAIDLEMISDRRSPNLVMRLRFTGVVDLKLENFGGVPTQVMASTSSTSGTRAGTGCSGRSSISRTTSSISTPAPRRSSPWNRCVTEDRCSQ